MLSHYGSLLDECSPRENAPNIMYIDVDVKIEFYRHDDRANNQ